MTAGTSSEASFANVSQRLLSSRAIQTIDVDVAVQVVALVLDAAGHELLTLNDNLLAVQIRALAARVPGTLGWVPQVRNRQASLVAVLVLVLAQGDDAGVEHVADLPVDVPGEGT